MTEATENLEVKEDPTVSQSPLMVFIATLPNRQNRHSACLNEVENIKDINILHPYYDFDSEVGKKTLDLIGDVVPTYDNAWESTMRKDMFCIEKSDVVIFDLDTPDIIHYLAMAVCFNKPIIAVSSTLLSIPAYFSGSVSCIVKPKQIANILKMVMNDANFLKLPQPKNTETLLDSKYRDAVNQVQEQIDASWGEQNEKDAESNKDGIESACNGDSDSKIPGRKKAKGVGISKQETGEVGP